MPKSSIPVHAYTIALMTVLGAILFVYFFVSILGAKIKFHKVRDQTKNDANSYSGSWECSMIYLVHGDAAIRDVEQPWGDDVFVGCQEYLKICQNLLPAHLGLSESLQWNLST